ncbi:MAG: 4Fe-4S dicluster domain-containing protein [Bryobacterales bacterium]|nr:4Fe-4S dicluster domain-containing protein [Bryobacterales bacterium]
MAAEQLKQMGVVGAGGAGFPTHVKAGSQAEVILANGAECEPLLHKDLELMVRYAPEICAGLERMAGVTGARAVKFGIKEKNKRAVEKVSPEVQRRGWGMVLLGDFYPSGDEYELVYAGTGRLIPAGGIPLQVGCVVNNVETLYNVEMAAQGQPVTRKFLTVTGAVRKPQSFWAPVGITFRELIVHVGGVTTAEFGVFVSGLMMGSLTFDLDDVVTKTTGGLIVLPRDHYLITRKTRPVRAMAHIGKSACDQCSYCTEFCPRFLLGYDVQPHRVMRSLGFTLTGADNWNQWGELCCACGLCTLYACPEDLYPKEACDQAKTDLRNIGKKYVQQHPVKVHPMKEYRRVPLSMLRKRLKVDEYECEAPFRDESPVPKQVRIRMKQHAGKPAQPVVKAGQTVKAGDTVGRMADKDLGADVHASIAGVVRDVTAETVVIDGQ